MIRFGLRLTLNGGREACVRLVLISVAVALGVGMLLATLAGINGVNSQNARYGWLGTGTEPATAAHNGGTGTADPLWWLLSADEFRGQLIGRVDVAATGPRSPIPPGIARLPGPGQYYASPALSELLLSTPADELGARYPGSQIGTIGSAALPAPNSLIIVIGRTRSELAHVAGATQVTSISTVPPSSCNGSCYDIGVNANGIDLILSVVAAALLFPVLVFIATATRLSAARREQRFAAMRLVGATPRQISVISTVESSLAAVIGVSAGFGVFLAVRPVLAPIPFTGASFFTSDLSLNPIDIVAVALGVPVAAAVAARIALRRVSISPLGVSRRVTPLRPRPWRVIPLLAGLGELAWFVHAGRPATTPGQIQAYLTGILLTMVGLILAGPWLTMIGARLVSRRAKHPELLISGRRLADNPQAGFRAVSGLVLALFVTSVAIGVITTITSDAGGSRNTPVERTTLIARFTTYTPAGPRNIASIPSSLVGGLAQIPGLHGVSVFHAEPSANPNGSMTLVVSCGQLAGTPILGRCPAGATAVRISDQFDWSRGQALGRTWPAVSMSAAEVERLPVQSIAVAANAAGAVEQARTMLLRTFPHADVPTTISEDNTRSMQRIAAYQQLANVVILTSLPIAGCSLAVSVVAGLNDRKRPFSLLRLAGAPVGMLQRVVALESAVPLLVIAAVSVVVGFLVAGMFLTSQLRESLRPPGLGYYLIVLAGLVASLAMIASTLPFLRRITGPEVARND